jgi:hypothetical protein
VTTAARTIASLSVPVIAERIAALDWQRITDDLDAHGCASPPSVLRPEECAALADTYTIDERFRRRIVMAQHGFGRGEYKYFAYPLPDVIAELRTALYPRLAGIANRWNESMGTTVRYPADHAAFLQRCHRAGQTRPTPLLLQYGEGDYNCLHQDLYGGARLPVASHGSALGAGTGLYRWRIRADRAAATDAIASRGRLPRSGRRRHLSGVSPARAGSARHFSGQSAPWREPGALRPPPYGWHHLPRCPMSRTPGGAWINNDS